MGILGTKQSENKKIKKLFYSFFNLPTEGKALFYYSSTLNVENKRRIIKSILMIIIGFDESFDIKVKVYRTKKFKVTIQVAIKEFRETITKSKSEKKQALERLVITLLEAR